jgi:hypothetical protein
MKLRLVVLAILSFLRRNTAADVEHLFAPGVMGKRLLATCLSVVASIAVFGVASSEARVYYRHCPGLVSSLSILAHGTSCSQARKVMQKVYVKSQEVAPQNGALGARGWTCSLDTSEKRAITCRRGSGVIKAPTPG